MLVGISRRQSCIREVYRGDKGPISVRVLLLYYTPTAGRAKYDSIIGTIS